MRHAVDLDHDSLQTLSCHLSRSKFCISVPWEREGLAAYASSPLLTQLVVRHRDFDRQRLLRRVAPRNDRGGCHCERSEAISLSKRRSSPVKTFVVTY